MKQMDMFVTKWVNPTANYFAAFEDARLRTFDLEIWRKFLSDEAHPAVSGSALDAGTDDAISGIQHFIKLSKEHYMPSKVIIGITVRGGKCVELTVAVLRIISERGTHCWMPKARPRNCCKAWTANL